MIVINNPRVMQKKSDSLRLEGKKIVFIPTMGGLHEGHLSLVDIAKKNGDTVVLSIYLNPKQFGENEDLSSYPAILEKDTELAKARGVDIVFTPSTDDIYPENFQTFVDVEKITKSLCGNSRPTHFRGVTTVVLKLFNIVKPHSAIFGRKDYQQLQVIKKMVDDLNLDIEIIGAPIVREPDGLAMSSRNAYLSNEERNAALSINESLKLAQSEIDKGNRNIQDIINLISKHIESSEIGKVDYVKICNPESLEELNELKLPALLAIAAFFGKARLIDNVILCHPRT